MRSKQLPTQPSPPSFLWDWTYVPLHPGCLLSGSTILSALIICLPTCSHFIIWRISNNFLWWHLEWYALLVSVDAKGPFSHGPCYCHILEDGGLTLLSWQTMCPELKRWHHLFLVYCERQATVACLPSHLLPASLLLFFLFLAMELSLGEEKDTINYFKSAKQERCMKAFTTDKGSKNTIGKPLYLETLLLMKKMLKHASGITVVLLRASYSAVTRINESEFTKTC